MTRNAYRFLWMLTLCLPILFGAETKPKKQEKSGAKTGIQTPGIQVAIASLKPEAEIALKGKISGMIFADQVFVSADEMNQIASIDPKTNKLSEKSIKLEKPCGGIARAFGSLWVPNCEKKELSRIDAKTGAVKATIPMGNSVAVPSIAATADSIWLLSDDRTTLLRIDPDENLVVGEIRLPEKCNSMVTGDNSLWVTCPAKSQILRIDPKKNLVEQRIEVASQPVSSVFGEGSIWVLCKAEGKVARIDPKTNKVIKTIDLGIPDAAGNISFGEGSVWVTSPGFPISRIQPDSDQVVQQFKGPGGGLINVGLGSVWLANSADGSLWRVDPKRIAATLAE